MNEELENIFKQVATDLHNKPRKNELIALTSWNDGDIKTTFGEINDTERYVKFNDELKKLIFSMEEFESLLDYLRRNNYEWR